MPQPGWSRPSAISAASRPTTPGAGWGQHLVREDCSLREIGIGVSPEAWLLRFAQDDDTGEIACPTARLPARPHRNINGLISKLTSEIRSTGKPARRACSRTASWSGASYSQ